MYAPYPENMMESIKKVEATRAQRMATEPRRLTAEEKDALLEKFHHRARHIHHEYLRQGLRPNPQVSRFHLCHRTHLKQLQGAVLAYAFQLGLARCLLFQANT